MSIKKHRNDYYYKKAKAEKYKSRAAYKLLEINKNFKILKNTKVIIDLFEDYIKFIKGDITKDTIISELNKELPRPADLLISDCSPKLIGAKDTDHARQIYLAECSLNIAKNCLRIGGNFLTKVFQGDMLDQFKEKVMKIFHSCRIYKPKASPRNSREEYLIAFGLKAKKFIN